MENLTENEKEFIITSLNDTWHNSHTQLQRKDLGDIERKNYEYSRDKAKELMKKIDPLC